MDAWYKDISPSTALRNWFDNDPDKWEFRNKYKAEFANKGDTLEEIRSLEIEYKKILLIYSSKEERFNNGVYP